MEIVTSTSAIVPEVLKEDNYERWSILMEHYLVAQDLWDVVQSSKMPPGEGHKRDWMKKNALALHAIGVHTGVFNAEEQKKIAECIYDLQRMDWKGQLRERTYLEPRKWMRGKGRVTIQFSC